MTSVGNTFHKVTNLFLHGCGQREAKLLLQYERYATREHMFKKAEKKMLKLVLRICRDLSENINLRLKDIELQFTRRNYENIQSKSQVLVSMLQQPKIHPLLAFQHSGLFVDPERAYTLSMKYYEEQQEKLAQQQKTAQNNTDGSGNPNGSDEDE